MEIEIKRPSSIIYNLIDGTVFYYDDEYFIKTNSYNSAAKRCTCVNLSNGALYELSDNIVVQYYDAKVVVQ